MTHRLCCLLLALTLAPVRGDATEPAHLVRDLLPGASSSSPSLLGVLDGIACLLTQEEDWPAGGTALWRSDGTAEGTVRVAHLPLVAADPALILGKQLLLAGGVDDPGAPGPGPGRGQLWSTDCTAAGTHLVHEFGSLRFGHPLATAGGLAFFQTATYEIPAPDDGIFATDGTPEGTWQVLEGTLTGNTLPFTVARGNELFCGGPANQPGLWRTDGTRAGVEPVPGAPPEAFPLLVRGADLFATASDAQHGRELWRLRGTSAVRLTDLGPGPATFVYSGVAAGHGILLFSGDPDAPYHTEYSLHRSDGVNPGSEPLVSGFALPRWLDVRDGRSYFVTNGTVPALWVSDGTSEGTGPLRQLSSGAGAGLSVEDRLYFSAGDEDRGFELWTSDGTSAGTVLLQDICPGACGSAAREFAQVGERLLFTADDGVHGAELWALDLPAARADLTSPAPGSLIHASETFAWTAGAQVQEHWLDIGSTPGGSDLFSASLGNARRTTVSGLPFDGSPVHVRLWSRLPDGWVFRDSAHESTPPAAAELRDPDVATLPKGPVALRWSPGANAEEYWLQVGTAPGLADVLDASQGLRRFARVQVPTDAGTWYVRLWTRLPGAGWVHRDRTYATPNLGEAATLTAPMSGSTLASPRVTFEWSQGLNADEYWLQIGRSPGGTEVLDASMGQAVARSVENLPLDGGPVHVRLWTRLRGVGWRATDAAFTAASALDLAAALTQPAPGSPYQGPAVDLAWTPGEGALEYWLTVSGDGHTYLDASQSLGLSRTVAIDPLASVLRVELWTRLPGAGWVRRSSEFPLAKLERRVAAQGRSSGLAVP